MGRSHDHEAGACCSGAGARGLAHGAPRRSRPTATRRSRSWQRPAVTGPGFGADRRTGHRLQPRLGRPGARVALAFRRHGSLRWCCATWRARTRYRLAMLNLGGVTFPWLSGPLRYTLNADEAIELCRELNPPVGRSRCTSRVGNTSSSHATPRSTSSPPRPSETGSIG